MQRLAVAHLPHVAATPIARPLPAAIPRPMRLKEQPAQAPQAEPEQSAAQAPDRFVRSPLLSRGGFPPTAPRIAVSAPLLPMPEKRQSQTAIPPIPARAVVSHVPSPPARAPMPKPSPTVTLPTPPAAPVSAQPPIPPPKAPPTAPVATHPAPAVKPIAIPVAKSPPPITDLRAMVTPRAVVPAPRPARQSSTTARAVSAVSGISGTTVPPLARQAPQVVAPLTIPASKPVPIVAQASLAVLPPTTPNRSAISRTLMPSTPVPAAALSRQTAISDDAPTRWHVTPARGAPIPTVPPAATPSIAVPMPSPPATVAPAMQAATPSPAGARTEAEAPPAVAQPPSLQGELLIDGMQMGRWLAETIAKQAAGPPTTARRFNSRVAPAWPGLTS